MRIVLDEGAYMPAREHETDAGLDLKTPFDAKVPAHGSVCIDTGVHVELPAGTYGKLESKSGLMTKHQVCCPGGVIDEPYRGSIVVMLCNDSDKDYWFATGDKIVQLLIVPYVAPKIELATELSETDRGENGFGSTGR